MRAAAEFGVEWKLKMLKDEGPTSATAEGKVLSQKKLKLNRKPKLVFSL